MKPRTRWGIFILAMLFALPLGAQNQGGQDPNNSTQQSPNKQEPPPEAGGPQGDQGPYVIPKKKEEPPPPPPEKPKKIEGMPDYSIAVDVPLVTVDVSVRTKEGQFIPGLEKQQFAVYEDGVLQTVTGMDRDDNGGMTSVMLIEFASTNYFFMYDALDAAYTYAATLKKNDWVAVISYDMKPEILVDFTQNKQDIRGALNMLRIPGFSETNLFDALFDTIDRLERVDGQKSVILISTGVDTFSKLNLDQIYKKVRNSKDITIYAVSIGWYIREYCETHGCTGQLRGMIPKDRMDYLQADNEMHEFAKLTGGQFFQPRFQGELRGVFGDIAYEQRNRYILRYKPTNPKLDGTYRKIAVKLVGPDGKPLIIKDQKNKTLKYTVTARDGYTARHTVD